MLLYQAWSGSDRLGSRFREGSGFPPTRSNADWRKRFSPLLHNLLRNHRSYEDDPLLAPTAPRGTREPRRSWRARDGDRRTAGRAGAADLPALAAVVADLRT